MRGGLRLLAWRCKLGLFCGLFLDGVCLVEAAQLVWNKVILILIHLVVFSSRDDDGLVRWRSTRSTAPDFGASCVGVIVLAALHGEARVEVVRFAVDRYDDLALSSLGLRWDGQIQVWVCTGCVPDRCLLGFFFPFVAGCYCGSSQSLWAMVLSWTCGWGRSSQLSPATRWSMAEAGERQRL
jgi:hypothetical protein